MTEETTEDIGKKLVNLEDLKTVYTKNEILRMLYGSIMNYEGPISYDHWEALYSETNPFQYIGFISGIEGTPKSEAISEFIAFCAVLEASGCMNGIVKIVDDDENILFRAILRKTEETPYRWMILAIID